MRAAIVTAPKTVEVHDVPTPSPGPGQVLLAIEGCGVCGSDIPVYEGRPWFEYPRDAGAPGHEGWGRIEAVGDGVGPLKPRMRVAAMSYKADAGYHLAHRANSRPPTDP